MVAAFCHVCFQHPLPTLRKNRMNPGPLSVFKRTIERWKNQCTRTIGWLRLQDNRVVSYVTIWSNHVLRPDHGIRQRQWCSGSTERMQEWKLVDTMGLQFKRWSGCECRLKGGLVTSLMWRDPSTINPQISRKHAIGRKKLNQTIEYQSVNKMVTQNGAGNCAFWNTAPRDIAKKTLPKHADQVDWISWNWPTSSWIHEHKQTNWLFELFWCEIKLKHQLVMDIWAHSSERYSKWTESWQDRSNHRISKHRHAQKYSK